MLNISLSRIVLVASIVLHSLMFASNINSKIEKIDEYSCSDFEKDCMGVCGGHAERDEDGGCTVSNNRSDSYTYDEISYSWQSGNMTSWEGCDDCVQTFNLPFTFPVLSKLLTINSGNLSLAPMLKINLDSNFNNTSPEFLSIVPSSCSIYISILKPGGNGRDKNLVDFEVRGGIENVLDEKLICRRLLF